MIVDIYEALDLIDQNISTVDSYKVPLEEALYKISSKRVLATLPLPIFNNSAMDGYGLNGESDSYKVIGKILAGDSHTYELKSGEAIKILTGAKVPQSVDTVIPQENVTIKDNIINIRDFVKKGANIRYLGEDINIDEVIVDKGEVITSAHIALLASQGICEVEVYRDVKVGVFASGSELKLYNESLDEGEIYNSNTPYLIARSKELGADSRFIGKCLDSKESIKEIINSSLDYDLIVTSGGVSVGEADFTKEAFLDLGMKILFERVNVKPGKPTTFGKIKDTFILNLAGNPLAGALNFEIFGKFTIKKLSGANDSYHDYIKVRSKSEITSKRATSNIIPGVFCEDSFTMIDRYAPGNVNVLNRCNGMIIIDKDRDKIEKDDIVKFIPIRWELLCDKSKKFTS
jgi:molybdopterin molybdotransferase